MNERKRVAFVLAPSRQAVSGVTTHLNLMLGSGLPQDFSLIHFQVGSEGRRESAAGRWWRLLWSPLGLALRLLLARADLVHINTSLNRRAWWRDVSYLLVARMCGVRVVYQVHGGYLPRRFAAVERIPAALLRAILELPDVIVLLASCELVAYREFLPRQKLAVLPNGIDVSAYRTRTPVLRRPGTGPLQLVYVGRLVAHKGVPETLEGLALARKQGVAATLLIAGSGPDEPYLRSLAERLGIADVVHFAGPLFDDAKRRALEAADVLLLPSHFEGLPYALLEGMAAGLPAIATRVGAIPDVMDHGVHGLFVSVGKPRAICNAIVRLARNPGLRITMGIAGQRHIAQAYSIGRLADEFGRLYRSLTSDVAAAAADGS